MLFQVGSFEYKDRPGDKRISLSMACDTCSHWLNHKGIRYTDSFNASVSKINRWKEIKCGYLWSIMIPDKKTNADLRGKATN